MLGINAIVIGSLAVGRNELWAEDVKLTDPVAVALCYSEDSKNVNSSDPKCSRHKPDQNCSNCQLYKAKPGDKRGLCDVFQKKMVSASGWCASWVKRA
ncbi:MAG: iron permease [Deltaproteobacteria bacterium CG11_big_fil_rev_8_21_14_0_20_45_16]|nr:MAG: iron permease [Deltaproteobacteria bacterium CG11_big_fil_rev_8_21_14_0_20_45_16]